MTAREKTELARLLDLTQDYLRDGFRLNRGEYAFSDDPVNPAGPAKSPAGTHTEAVSPDNPALPRTLEDLAAEVNRCTGCPLHTTRTHAVPGEGVNRPLVMVIGEGPGADEDKSGRPFVGRAGQLLDRILDSGGQIGLSRKKNCFIANIVKCRPPMNRDPLPGEIAACIPFLHRQIELLQPKLILCAGRVSAHTLLNTEEGIGKLRGRFTTYRGIPLLPTYHPSALLRNETLRRPVWEDMKLLRAALVELDGAYADEVSRIGPPNAEGARLPPGGAV